MTRHLLQNLIPLMLLVTFLSCWATQIPPLPIQNDKLLGSWLIQPTSADEGGQRIEFHADGTVFHYWGSSRQETVEWPAEDFGPAERAYGTWRIEGQEVIVTFLLGKEWFEDRGKPLRTMRGQPSPDFKTMKVYFRVDNPDFAAWGGEEVLQRNQVKKTNLFEN